MNCLQIAEKDEKQTDETQKMNENESTETKYISLLSLNTFFIEKYEKSKIEYLLSLDYDELLFLVYEKYESDQDGNTMTPIQYVKYLRQLLTNIYENDCEIKCFYKQRSNNRLYCAKSAQAYQYKVRGFLLSHLIDYDMKNCHPQILLYLCNKYNIYSGTLKNYCENRNEFLQKSELTKFDILKAINSDKNTKKKDNYIYNGLIEELKQIKENILKHSEIKFTTDNQKNPISSKINKLLCYYENLILNRVIAKYKDLISVLMFDGFMATANIPIEELNKLSADFGITWTIKPHDKSIQIPEDFTIDDIPCYSFQKEKFEREVFHIKNNDSYYRIVGNDYFQYSRMGLIDLSEQFRILNEKGVSISIWKEWIKDINKRSYNNFIFDPAMKSDPDLYYNTFDGFACKDWKIEESAEITCFHELINNLCNDEENVINYILDYLAHMIQKPAEKSGKIIIFRGLEGVGKDSFHLLIEKILGKKYCLNTENFEDIFGKYNIAIKNKIFICLNETNSDDARKYKDSLKAFATAEKTKYADKNVKAVEQHNYSRLFLFTNSATPVNLEMTSRRYVIIKTGWQLLNDTQFWNNFYKNINDENFIKSVYDYLMNRDISNFKINNTPVTEEYKLIKENSVHPVIEYLKEICNNNEINSNYEYDSICKCHIIKRENFNQILEDYLEINKYDNYQNLLKKKVITNAIKDIGGITLDKLFKRDNKVGRYMLFNFDMIKTFFIKTKIIK